MTNQKIKIVKNKELLQLAILGDNRARMEISHRYEEGLGTEEDLVKAYAWAFIANPCFKNPSLSRIQKRLDKRELNIARVFAIKLFNIL